MNAIASDVAAEFVRISFLVPLDQRNSAEFRNGAL